MLLAKLSNQIWEFRFLVCPLSIILSQTLGWWRRMKRHLSRWSRSASQGKCRGSVSCQPTAFMTKPSSVDQKGNFGDKLRAFKSQNSKPTGPSTKLNLWLSWAVDRISSLEDLCLRRISQLSAALVSPCHLKFHTAPHKAFASTWLSLTESSSAVTANWSRPLCRAPTHGCQCWQSFATRYVDRSRICVWANAELRFVYLFLQRRGAIQSKASRKSGFLKVWHFGWVIRPHCQLWGLSLSDMQKNFT